MTSLAQIERPMWPAMRRGWGGTCPNCGQGAMMQGFLAVRPACDRCGTEFHHHRADDGPAYLTILIVGHIMAPLLMFVFVHYRPQPMTLIVLFSAFTIGLSLYLLPRIKGALVALQWAKQMHGFGGHDD